MTWSTVYLLQKWCNTDANYSFHYIGFRRILEIKNGHQSRQKSNSDPRECHSIIRVNWSLNTDLSSSNGSSLVDFWDGHLQQEWEDGPRQQEVVSLLYQNQDFWKTGQELRPTIKLVKFSGDMHMVLASLLVSSLPGIWLIWAEPRTEITPGQTSSQRLPWSKTIQCMTIKLWHKWSELIPVEELDKMLERVPCTASSDHWMPATTFSQVLTEVPTHWAHSTQLMALSQP